MDPRIRWISQRVVTALGVGERSAASAISESGDLIDHVLRDVSDSAPNSSFLFSLSPAGELKVGTKLEAEASSFMYFLKAAMEEFFDFGVVPGSSLHVLGRVLGSVYAPLLSTPSSFDSQAQQQQQQPAQQPTSAEQLSQDASQPGTAQESSQDKSKDKHVTDSLRTEFISNLKRFVTQCEVAEHQLTGEVRFRMPDIAIDSVRACAEDYQSMSHIETAVEEWTPVIQSLLESLERFPKGQGAMAEVNFWNDRRAALSGAYEQLNNPLVKKMVEVLELADSPNALPFRSQYNELAKQHLLAEENVKFLGTLERHFKNLAHGTIQSIIDTLPSMMSAIKMVWLISRHYSKDEHMTPLMERIAWDIASQVQRSVTIRTVFRDAAARARIGEAKSLLQKWKQSYMDVRAKVEEDDPELHWEFDRRRLFEQTDYMADICANLADVAEVMEQFNNIPMLKAVTGNSFKIDEVLTEVRRLISVIEAVSFDIFDRKNQSAWDTELRKFNHNAREIDLMIKEFINESFSNLRSAEDAFDLLLKYKTIKTRPSINKLMGVKFADVLKRYAEEVERVHMVFKSQQKNPPIAKNQPPVAGSILWSQLLFEKLKKTIVRFQSLKDSELLSSDLGAIASREYLKLGKIMRSYESSLFASWSANVEHVMGTHLKKSILTQSDERISVNFHDDLRTCIRDAKYLDSLGFQIPSTALNVCLQEEKYKTWFEQLDAMLTSFYKVKATIEPEEIPLLENHIKQVMSAMRPGLETLNWTSLGISEFVKRCNMEINTFQSVINTVHIHVAKIASVAEDIYNATVCCKPTPLPGEDTLDIQEFFDQQEKFKNTTLNALVKKYRSISGSLAQIESVAFPGKPTMKCPQMRAYYALWERRIFNALNKMVLRNLVVLQGYMTKPDRQPLFRVVASLSSPEIVIHPSAGDITKYMTLVANGIVESTGRFVRWQAGKCVECPEQHVGESEEPFVFSFLTDISANPQVIRTMLQITQSVQRTIGNIGKYLSGWLRYRVLWKLDREIAMDRCAGKNLTCVEFDEKMSLYAKLASEVQAINPEKDVDFIRLSSAPLIQYILTEAAAWGFAYGKLLNDSARTRVQGLNETFLQYETDLERIPETMDDLKFILGLIEQLRERTNEFDARQEDILERYRTLAMFKHPVSIEEIEAVPKLALRLRGLQIRCREADTRLQVVKKQFTETTKNQVAAFQEKISKFKSQFDVTGPAAPEVTLEGGLELIEKSRSMLESFTSMREELVLAEKLFGLPITSYPELSELEAAQRDYWAVFDTFRQFKDTVQQWSGTLWTQLDINVLTTGTDNFVTKLRRLPKSTSGSNAYRLLQEKVKSFQDGIPLIRDLKSDALRPRHWQKLAEITGQSMSQNKSMTLETVFSMELSKFSEQISEVVNGAAHELTIENTIATIANTWKTLRFEVVKYSKGTEDRGYILKSIDDIQAQYEDNQMTLQTMASSKHVGAFLQQVQKWEKRVALIEEVAQEWMLVQKKWLYLENIFIGNQDILVRLPEEAKRFQRIDKTFKKVMSETAKNTLVLEACSADGRLELLKSLHQQLQICQHALSEYLETKRQAFARFYFISDDELLSILGSTDVNSLQMHMNKLFDSVIALKLGGNVAAAAANVKWVTGLVAEGESIDFRQNVATEGTVESWMSKVETEMKTTLKAIAKEAVYHRPSMPMKEWIDTYPNMSVQSSSQIWWTWDVEDTFRQIAKGDKYGLKALGAKMQRKMLSLVELVRGELSSRSRAIVNTLIIIEVFQRDVVDGFIRDSILSEDEFGWLSQLRFYWDQAADDVVIKQCGGHFQYGHEYLGLGGRLVVTPLTVRCVMTLTQALTHRLGGAPAGPAGTGKTETVKDLSRQLGLICKVYNCGEGVDYSTTGRLLSGLVQCGGWGCFDEFNRILPEVLSVISIQISTIQNAAKAGLKKFPFSGKELTLDMRTGNFVTMNPGYAGRSELPDNLKALFRPVVMVVPDFELITEIILFSQGFNTARILGKKTTALYTLAKQQLSAQCHYDWGLRALKSVLSMAGAVWRASLASGVDTNEEAVLLKAIQGMNLPKLVFADVPIFRGILHDLFPGVVAAEDTFDQFKTAIEDSLREKDYKILPEQVKKIVQLYETMSTRHCVMVIGPTGSGKSVIVSTLQAALNKIGQLTKLFVLNPKSQEMKELYGWVDSNTRQWHDGLLSTLFREANAPQNKDKKMNKYIVLDGDVDPRWVEDMNSVMDDSKQLTLPNGECVRMQPWCELLFEVKDLDYASPATVSRCGMIFVPQQMLGYEPFFWRWVRSRNKADQKVLSGLFDKYMPGVVSYVFRGIQRDGSQGKPLHMCVPLTELAAVRQLCTLLDVTLPKREHDKEPIDAKICESVFLFSLVWSVGSCLTQENRSFFDTLIKGLSGWPSQMEGAPTAGPGVIPTSEPTLYDFWFNEKESLWMPWASRVEPFSPAPGTKFHNMVVPTTDTVRYTWLLEACMSTKQPVLFVGDSGTGKTFLIRSHLARLNPENFMLLNVNFSSRTSSMDMQRTIEYQLERHGSGTYGPPGGKTMITFIDDMNMPLVDAFGTQQPIALLKLLLDRGGMYDRGEELNWKSLRNVQFVAAMGLPGGGRNAIDPRVLSLFNVFNITFPSDENLNHIYSSILRKHLDPFHDGIKEAGAKVVDATLRLYKFVIGNLAPTPAKFHYVFNLRDLARVYEGLCLCTLDKFDTVAHFVRLWRNECTRVFCDRLVTDADRGLVLGKIAETLREIFPEESGAALGDPMLFGDFRTFNTSEEVRIFEDMGDYPDIRTVLEEVLATYNERHQSQKMSIVLFDYVVEHVVRAVRVIRRPRGHALLIGINGSGKRSVTRLAAFAAGYALYEIRLSRGYGEEQFKEHLKELYRMLGMENKEVVFMFTDAHVVKEGFLETINTMLTSGMVPALFEDNEKEEIKSQMHDEAARTRRGANAVSDGWTFFVNRCRENLHVVLCMSPAGEALRQRCRNFPGLVYNVAIDWFHKWPEDALQSVAEAYLGSDVPEDLRKEVVAHMVLVHQLVSKFAERFEAQLRRTLYITPQNFLDFINTYTELVSATKRQIDDQYKRLDSGLQKLIEAAVQIEELNARLQTQRTQVEEQTRICNELLQSIGEKKTKVEAAQLLASTKEKELNELMVQIDAKKQEAEADLEAALPALEGARVAVQNLKRDEVTEIRTFALPPKAVQSVCECICWMLGAKEINWKSAKAIMASPNFLGELLELDPDTVTDKQVKGVRDILKKSELTLEKMEAVSMAAKGLLTWVEAILNYHTVAKKVKPKRAAVELALKQQKQNQKDLETIKAEAKMLTTQIEMLNREYQTRTKEQHDLKEQAELMEKRLIAAKQLISGLGTERVRWAKDMETLKYKRERVVGDCLLCASFLTYAGPFTAEFRSKMINDDFQDDIIARKIPLSFPFRLEQILADDVKLNQWASEELPPDELSVQNGMLTLHTARYALCIDPQMQANTWIKKREAKNQLIVRSLTDPDFSKQLELAVSYGVPLLIEGVGEALDPILEPVLSKNIITNGSQRMIRLGDKEIDWNEKFRLYVTSKLPNPKFDPNLFGKVNVINYGVTQAGLQDQLLSIVVAYEHPDLEKTREELVRTRAEGQKQLKQCEDSLLDQLANAKGMMLDNQELIQTLEQTKRQGIEIAEKLEQTKVTAFDLEKTREGYRPIAKRGAVLFHVISGLSALNTMYVFSLNAYKELFKASLSQSVHDTQLSVRLANVVNMLTKRLYEWTCMGLFERDKLTFSLHMCTEILKGEDRINARHLDFFLRGNTSLEKPKKKPPLASMTEQGFRDFLCLCSLGGDFAELEKHVDDNADLWRAWVELEEPEDAPPPLTLKENRNFGLLMLLRVFRIDRVHAAVRRFVAGEMGDRYVKPPVIMYQSVFEQSSPTTPVVCILSPGADPLTDIAKLADKLGIGAARFKPFALGQDQGDPAAQLVENGAARGQWIVLQNCHLLPSWLPTLEKLLEKLDKSSKDFRLWLTTEPTRQFPVGILQRCLKVVTEPPNGLKMNMRQSFSKISEESLTHCPHPAFRPLVYVLSFFHAVLQERRKYGSIGWNIPYDFNESDFNVSFDILATELNRAYAIGGAEAPVPWGSLRYLIGEVMYGGRVTDNFDRRIVATYLQEYMGDFLFDSFQPFSFYKDDKVSYVVPPLGSVETYVAAIEALPDMNAPDVVGLHGNAEIGYTTAAAREMWTGLLEMQPRTEVVGQRRETMVAGIANSILSTLPAVFDIPVIDAALAAARKGADITPSEVVLLQELDHWNKLVARMHLTLTKLQRALIGELAMDDELEAMQNSLLMGALPRAWRELAPPTLKTLADWLVQFQLRHAQYKAWTTSEPVVMWLAGLHVPQAYLTSLIQTAGRKMGWSLDKTALMTVVTRVRDPSTIKDKPELGCFISGIFLEGASWDGERGILAPQRPKELVTDMPVVQLVPVESHKKKSHGKFRTPVYVTPARRNRAGEGLVFEADLSTDQHPSHWVLQGVALYLNNA
eukprot:m51a1_g2800 putative dynein heavy chain axonemal (4501) ;mRNA; f:77561-92205